MSTPWPEDLEEQSDDSTRLLRFSPSPRNTPTVSPDRRSRAEYEPLLVGTTLLDGRLTVNGELGEGGMGIVYEVHDAERSEAVALKTLARPDAGHVYQLKAEFRSLADLVHSNLVRLYQLFVVEERCFFTMELVRGVPFHQYVRPYGMLDEAALREALPQLLAAIAAIHAVGKLHRDLKPRNVLVTRDGRVAVLDFGLVAEPGLLSGVAPIDEGMVVGTPRYMAPEQVSGGTAGPAVDLYALGVMLFEALTGQLPHSGRGVEMMLAKGRQPAPPVLDFAPDAPEDLADVCDQLLSIAPSERPSLEAIRDRLGYPEPEPPSARRAAPRPVTPSRTLVGRDAELALLSDAYQASRCGDKAVVALVSGESGIGKSALAASLLERLRREGEALVLGGRCYEREALPYKAFDAIVDELSRFLRRSDEAELSRILPADVAALRRLFPVLGRVPRMLEADAQGGGDVRELRRRGFLAFGDLLARIGERRPVVLYIDDLQWSDADSTTLLLHLLRRPTTPRLLLVGTYRSGESAPEVLGPLFEALEGDSRIDARALCLGPLAPAAAEELARQLSSRDPHALVREAGGSPFLLEELARRFAHHDDADTPAGPLSLSTAVQSRVERLEQRATRLLRVLAVAGRPLPLATAAAAADLDTGAHSAMDLLRAECLTRSAGSQDGVECYHDRIREAVVAGLPVDELRRLHLSLAMTLAAQRAADSEHLSLHYEQAGETVLAGEHAREAALRAVKSLAFERAVGFCERALSLGSFSPEQTQELRCMRADALAYAGRGPQAADAYLEASQRADRGQSITLKRHAAEQLLMSGDLKRGHGLLADTLALMGIKLPRGNAKRMASLAVLRLRARFRGLSSRPRATVSEGDRHRLEALVAGGSALSRTDPVAAAETATRHLLLALRVGSETDVARALAWEVLFARMLEDPPARILEAIERARAAAESSGDWEARASFHRHFGFYLRSKAYPDMQGALAELERSLALHREHPLPNSYYDRPWGEWNRDLVRVYLGRFSEVGAELPAHLDEALRRSDMCIYPMWASLLLPRLATGHEGAAEADFARAQRLWRHGSTLQSLSLLEGQTMLANFRAEPERVTPALELALRSVTRPLLTPPGSIVGLLAGLRAQNAARRAELTGSRVEREALAQLILASASLMGRSLVGWTDHTDAPVLAAAAYLQGDQVRAIEQLRRGMQRLSGVPIVAQACKRRLGVLLGGDEGRALIDESDSFFRDGGARDPERIAALLTPGFG